MIQVAILASRLAQREVGDDENKMREGVEVGGRDLEEPMHIKVGPGIYWRKLWVGGGIAPDVIDDGGCLAALGRGSIVAGLGDRLGG